MKWYLWIIVERTMSGRLSYLRMKTTTDPSPTYNHEVQVWGLVESFESDAALKVYLTRTFMDIELTR